MEFVKNGKSIILYKDNLEPDYIFFKRGLFIINQKDLSNLNELIKLSKVWANYKFKNCEYSNNLIKKIKILDKNLEYF